MALPLFQEKRLSVRKGLTGLLPGKLLTTNGKEVICQPKDISQHGMGVISQELLDVGSLLHMKFRDQDIELEVAWVRPGFSKRDLQRYGLVTKDYKIDLEAIFLEAGCLR